MRWAFLLVVLGVMGSAFGQGERRVTAVGPEVTVPTGGRWAFIVGVSQYEHDDINDLQFTGRDAQRVYQILTDPVRGGFDPDKVLLITEEQENPKLRPTLLNIMDKLKAFAHQARGAEEAFFYFSGHGFSREGVSYLLPSDVRLGLLERDGVRVPEIEEKLKEINPAKAVVILDACRNEPLKDVDARSVSAEGAMDDAFLGHLKSIGAVEGVAVLSSCKLGQRSWEDPELQSGVFTHYLVEAFGELKADKDNDGAVTITEAMAYLPERMKRWSLENAPKQQEPWFDFRGGGDMIIIGKRKPVEPGSLNIVTEPAGAVVFLNGQRRGKSPLTVLNLSPGQHSVLARLEGRAEASGTAFIRPGEEAFISLQLPQASGALRIDSTPSGAAVYLDDLLRSNTPLTLPGLSLGEHSLRLSLEGYYDYSATVTVKAGERALSISLSRISGPEAPALRVGFLAVSSEPEGIEVLVGGRPVGRTPLTTSVSPGSHQVELRSPLHEKFSQKVHIEEKKVFRLHRKMVSAFGSLTMSTDIQGASVFLDGRPVFKGPGKKTLGDVVLGAHEVVLRVPLGEVVRDVFLDKAKPLTLDLSRARVLGSITVLTKEPRTPLYLDGRPVAGSTPLTIEDVPAGAHVVSFRPGVAERGKLVIGEAAEVQVLPGRVSSISEFTWLQRTLWQPPQKPSVDVHVIGDLDPESARGLLHDIQAKLQAGGYLSPDRTAQATLRCTVVLRHGRSGMDTPGAVLLGALCGYIVGSGIEAASRRGWVEVDPPESDVKSPFALLGGMAGPGMFGYKGWGGIAVEIRHAMGYVVWSRSHDFAPRRGSGASRHLEREVSTAIQGILPDILSWLGG